MIVLVELFGAVALLLWGVRMVRTGVMRAWGTALRRLASRSAGRVLPAFLAGIAVAAALQSSTATAMIVASFAGHGIVTSATAFATIVGADVGTAIAVLIASQKITFLSPLFLAVGVFGFLSTENRKKRSLFRAVSGLGMVLLALTLVARIASDLAQFDGFMTVMTVFLSQPFLLLLIAAALTYLAHSSLAIVLLTTGFAANGLLDMESSLYLVLGANIGSGLLPVLANWSASNEARLPVTGHLILRAGVALAAFPFTGLITQQLSLHLTPASAPALFHLALNLAIAIIGLVLSGPILRLASAMLPTTPKDDKAIQPRHLDENALNLPATALACAKREALIMADHAQNMVVSSLQVLEENDDDLRRKVIEMDDTVDLLFNAIKLYIARILQNKLTEEESQRALDILGFTTNMEHIGDIVDGSLMQLAEKKIGLQAQFSDQGFDEIGALHEIVCANFDLAINTFVSEESELAHLLHAAKADVRKMESRSVSSHLERIGAGMADSLETSSLHLDVLRDLKRINSHLTAIAWPVLRASGEVRKTKWKQRKSGSAG